MVNFHKHEKASGDYVPAGLRLPINPEILRDGKEGCARGTQEGRPAPFKSIDFRTF